MDREIKRESEKEISNGILSQRELSKGELQQPSYYKNVFECFKEFNWNGKIFFLGG